MRNIACVCNKKRNEVAPALRNGSAIRDCYRPHPRPGCICDACAEAKQPGTIKEAA